MEQQTDGAVTRRGFLTVTAAAMGACGLGFAAAFEPQPVILAASREAMAAPTMPRPDAAMNWRRLYVEQAAP